MVAPSHGPNPVEERNLIQLKETVVREKADLGICFDGDGDRAVFVDEQGHWVSPDLITAMLGLYYFVHHPELLKGDRTVLHDIRSSNNLGLYIGKLGGEAIAIPTGHTAMQTNLKALKAVFGGELSAHYYLRDFYYMDSAWIAVAIVLSILTREGIPLSKLIGDIHRYHFSGEINFRIPEPEMILKRLQQEYSSGKVTEIEGLRIDYPDWWFMIRTSSTEPLMRLVVEAAAETLLQERVGEIETIILASGGEKIT